MSDKTVSKQKECLISPQKLLVKDPFPAIIGLSKEKNQIKSALLASRHIILVGAPGMGKTTLARNISALLDDDFIIDPITGKKSKTKILGKDRFVRVQGSPDLTAEDLIGDIDPIKALQFGPTSLEAFTPGKVFRAHDGVLFFDEVNRCGEKLQNALLQVLEEGTVTIGSYTIDVPSNFIFIGTMNPDDSSTEPLSDVFLDRFDLIQMQYPENAQDEEGIIKARSMSLTSVCPDNLTKFIVSYVRSLRQHPSLERKPSVRATIGLVERTAAFAQISGRKVATLADLKAVVLSVLAHRITLKPSVKYLQKPEQLISQTFDEYVSAHEPDAQSSDVP